MSMYNDAKERLKGIYEYCNEKKRWEFALSRDKLFALPSEERNTMKMHFKIMEEEGWIETYAPSIGTPYSYKLTAKGIKCVEDIVGMPVVHTTTYHVTNANNSIIGDNANNNTFNVGVDIKDLQILIEQNLSDREERKEILATLSSLVEKMETNQPLEKGFLAKISDKLQKCSWLSSPITALVIRYLTSPNNS